MNATMASLVRYSPMNPSMPKTPPRIIYPHQYDRVHDSYGPGVFLGWVCMAYGVAAHFGVSKEKRPNIELLDKDLVLVVAYPSVVAIHLIVQWAHYPSDRSKLWTTEDESIIQFAAAIWASTAVCVISLGINVILIYLLRDYRKRAEFVFLSSIWVFTAVIVVNSKDAAHGVMTFFGIFGAAFLSMVTPACIYGPLHFFIISVIHFCVSIISIVRGDWAKAIARFLWCIAQLVAALLISIPCGVILYGLDYPAAIPESSHSLLDLGQASALFFGILSLLFSGLMLAKEFGAKWWTRMLEKADYERRPRQHRYERVSDQVEMESQSLVIEPRPTSPEDNTPPTSPRQYPEGMLLNVQRDYT